MTEITEEVSIIQMANDIATIKQAILGNGVKGLCQRVNDLEASQLNNSKKSGFISGFWVVVGGAITYLFNYFRG